MTVSKEEMLVAGLEKIIAMNRQQAEDQYGNADKAEGWGCVQVARKAIADASQLRGEWISVEDILEQIDQWRINNEDEIARNTFSEVEDLKKRIIKLFRDPAPPLIK